MNEPTNLKAVAKPAYAVPAKQTDTKPTPPNSGMVRAKTAIPEVKVLAKLDAKGEDSFLGIISNLTGDPDFAQKFITCVKFQIRNAWKREGDKWVNPFNQVPVDSILEELYEGARRKVLPDGHNAYLITRLGKYPKAQLLVDYKGLIDCALREGIAVDVNAKEVCENDDIELDFGEVSRFRIDPRKPRGEIIGCVAYAILPSGRRKSVYLDRAELDQIAGCAQTQDVWGTWVIEMYKKSAIRRLFKTMQNTPNLTALCELDNRSYDLKKARPIARASTAQDAPVRSVTGSAPAALPAPETPSEAVEAQSEDAEQAFEAEPVFA